MSDYYDLADPLQRENFEANNQRLKNRGIKAQQEGGHCLVKKPHEKKPQRSLDQNAYLHVILGYFGSEVGCTLEYVKREYYKKLVNPDIFKKKVIDPFLGEKEDFRSSKELTTEEMSLSIERFRNWASMEGGIYIPEPSDYQLVKLMQLEVERNKQYI